MKFDLARIERAPRVHGCCATLRPLNVTSASGTRVISRRNNLATVTRLRDSLRPLPPVIVLARARSAYVRSVIARVTSRVTRAAVRTDANSLRLISHELRPREFDLLRGETRVYTVGNYRPPN